MTDNRVHYAYDFVTKAQSSFKGLAQPAQAAIVSSAAGRELESTIDDFFHGLPAFINVLQDIGKVHPYLNGKCRWHLDVT